MVFVVKQLPHPLFERVGDDLWHVHQSDGEAEAEAEADEEAEAFGEAAAERRGGCGARPAPPVPAERLFWAALGQSKAIPE